MVDSNAVEAVVDDMIFDVSVALDPLTDAEETQVKNRAKVGSARPSSLLYTYGPGSVMDLPSFSVMPAGLDDWDRIWRRRESIPTITEPRLLDVVRLHLGSQVEVLRKFPQQARRGFGSGEGDDLGIPARVFPQWLRCTGCDYLGPLPRFSYSNSNPYRPDQAQFTHKNCPGRGADRKGSTGRKRESPAVPAPHLLTCSNGHLDEFPYELWVHRGGQCPAAEHPTLKMRDVVGMIGSMVTCEACKASRGMAEAQGASGRDKLPQVCRGRHPHLDAFDKSCMAKPALIMMGASNLWFSSTRSIIVMPRTDEEETEALSTRLRSAVGVDKLAKYVDQIDVIRDLADGDVDLVDVSDLDVAAAVADALAPAESEESRHERLAKWDPVELLVPEWRYLQRPSLFPQQENSSGLMVTEIELPDTGTRPGIDRVVAVNKMKKVNAVIGFTRLDEMDRVNDLSSRLVKLTRNGKPTWVPATEDRGEGVFVQLDLEMVADWEQQIRETALWTAHSEAHDRNFRRRFSETAKAVEPDDRLPAPRYWLLHTFSHALIREMAMSCGYGAASLTERIYGWSESKDRSAAAGVLICTTSSDSDGTLGGLVALARPDRFQIIVESALRRASRCSSDPVCAQRTPSYPEDFLHGAACHCCSFASETSCEKSNRFLDRRFLLNLPSVSGSSVPGFFGNPDVF